MPWDSASFLPRERLHELLHVLGEGGRVVGPRVERQGDHEVLVLDEVHGVADLPVGRRDEQAPGRHTLRHAGDGRVFAYATGQQSWRRMVDPPSRTVWRATREADGRLRFSPDEREQPGTVLFGVRPCDLVALDVQDRVYLSGPHPDPDYRRRREHVLVVAVECSHPGSTCFCTSMGTGPAVEDGSGADIALTELDDGYVVRMTSEAGRAALEGLHLAAAGEDRVRRARHQTDSAAATVRDKDLNLPNLAPMGRRLVDRPASRRWSQTAERCLACTNCTLVCPTCFCSRDVHVSDLTGTETAVERRWDSCFSLDFATVSFGNFRPRRTHRYRQWLTHKFSTWWDQFDTSGCVGCGRCITWCPVGIDVREEVAAIGAGATAHRSTPLLHRTQEARGDRGAPTPCEIKSVESETADTWTLTLARPEGFGPEPGQIVLATLPGVGAPPISVSRLDGTTFDLTIRAVGEATTTITDLRPGAQLAVTEPFGRPWPQPEDGADVTVVAGGIGIAPLRLFIDELVGQRDRLGSLYVLVGARSPEDIVYRNHLEALGARDDLHVEVTVDRAGPGWDGPVGLVTNLLNSVDWDPGVTTVYTCGPEIMMQAVSEQFAQLGVPARRVFVTLERHMECGVGHCGHCQLGPFLLCRDGPVFSSTDIAPFFGITGL